MASRKLRTLLGSTVMVAVAGLSAVSCVVRLTDRNSPLDAGNVSGAAADCSQVVAPATGAPGGAAEIKYVGRFAFDGPKATYDWSGNYISARFEGDSVEAGLYTQRNDLIFQVVVDGVETKLQTNPRKQIDPNDPQRLEPKSEAESYYLLASGLGPGPHEIVLHRNTEALFEPVTFLGFRFGGGGKLLPPVRRPRRIEVIGDSISCGYGNEGSNATCPFDVEIRREKVFKDGVPVTDDKGVELEDVVKLAVTENQYLAYTTLAARELDADVMTECWSGKGVRENYKERRLEDDCDTKVTVPELWLNRTLGSREPSPPKIGPGVPARCAARVEGDPDDAERRDTGPKWDFEKEKPDEQPQVVLINLGTNDFARDSLPPAPEGTADFPGDNLPDGTIDRVAFKQAYIDFVKQVRARRKEAHIFLALPPMLSDQFPLDNARSDLRNILYSMAQEFSDQGDTKVYAMELVEQGVRYGLGCDYHPNLEVHRIMAKQVVNAIRSKTCW